MHCVPGGGSGVGRSAVDSGPGRTGARQRSVQSGESVELGLAGVGEWLAGHAGVEAQRVGAPSISQLGEH